MSVSPPSIGRSRFALAAMLAGVATGVTAAAGSPSPMDAPLGDEPYNTGWALYMDNDALTLVNRDEQYTGGLALTLSGHRAVEYPWSLDSALGWFNRVSGFAALSDRSSRTAHHSIEFGLVSFTPGDIEVREPIFDDRPYASAIFMSNTRQTVVPGARVSYQSTLGIGLLGTDVSRHVQNLIHGLIGSARARGWDNQISDGGEPTFSYAVSRQQPLWIDDDHRGFDYEIRNTVGASVGAVTQIMAGINWRWGRIRTPWWSSNPNFTEFIELGTPVASRSDVRGGPAELFLWGGLQLRQHFYNALFEGQFRDSEVTFDRDELRSTLGEASLGITWGTAGGTRVTVALRARTPELEDADGLDPVWGSIVISRAY